MKFVINARKGADFMAWCRERGVQYRWSYFGTTEPPEKYWIVIDDEVQGLMAKLTWAGV